AGPWEVRFAKGFGAPERTTCEKLIWWTDHADPKIRFFSGTASYTTSFELPPRAPGEAGRILLDLGRVGAMAQVVVNGRDLGVLWKPPFLADVTSAVRPGPN